MLAARLLTRTARATIPLVRQASPVAVFHPHILAAIDFDYTNVLKPFTALYLFAYWPLLLRAA